MKFADLGADTKMEHSQHTLGCDKYKTDLNTPKESNHEIKFMQ